MPRPPRARARGLRQRDHGPDAAAVGIAGALLVRRAPVTGTPPLTSRPRGRRAEQPRRPAGGARRPHAAVRRGAGGPHPHPPRRRRGRHAVPRHRRTASAAAASAGCSASPSIPRYAQNGRFFVNYTDRSGDTHIAEFRAAPGADTADAASERLILFVTQPFANHNGGGLAFGTDGMLYIGLGDGGSGGDPLGNGQNLATLLGKMLRIDVDRGMPVRDPRRQPVRGQRGGASGDLGLRPAQPVALRVRPRDRRPLHRRRRPERARGGRRRPRVAPRRRELRLEHHGRAAAASGRRPAAPPPGSRCPCVEYGRGDGCSITGGVVYRGCRMPGYHGTYFYGDYCSGDDPLASAW